MPWTRLVAYAPALLFLPVVLAPPTNRDVAALIEFGQRWSSGEALYSRLIDVNPPLIFALNRVPVALARLTGLDGILAFQLCVVALAAAVWWLCLRVRRRSDEGAIERAFLDVVPALVLVGGAADFGQREHLMTLCALPYLFAAAERASGRQPPHRLPIAALAALMFALKPHFLGIPALVELYVLFAVGPRAWARDPVPWTMTAIWGAYAASIPLLFPDYFGVTLPLAWSSYLALNIPVARILLVPRIGVTLLLALPLLAIAALSRDKLMKVLGLATVGGLASLLLQGKGWSYHILPFVLLGCALAGVVAARRMDSRKEIRIGAIAHVAAGMFGACVVLYLNYWDETLANKADYPGSISARLPALLAQTGAEPRVLVLSPDVWPVYPALNYAHMRSTMRAITLWILQGAYPQCLPDNKPFRDVADMGFAERFVFDTVAEDFAADPPGILIVDREPGIYPRCSDEFDLVAYFARHPRFAATWPRYRFFALHERLTIYRRTD